eukprot:TRINITY_DN26752_c0_g1_i1.p2 TRINITY_DN26752_c0_g1~~TRINITY_DN26752_c0_g1_i1.p2  ORF type:complete len:151 (-),score=38.02 TRINITY_DN26752_c0_g1_i1:631-1083(-)
MVPWEVQRHLEPKHLAHLGERNPVGHPIASNRIKAMVNNEHHSNRVTVHTGSNRRQTNQPVLLHQGASRLEGQDRRRVHMEQLSNPHWEDRRHTEQLSNPHRHMELQPLLLVSLANRKCNQCQCSKGPHKAPLKSHKKPFPAQEATSQVF